MGHRLLIAIVVAGLALTPAEVHAQSVGYDSTTDEFTGHTYILTGNIEGRDPTLGSVSIQFQKFTPKGGRATLQIFANYEGSDWMFIESGESLIFLIDDVPMKFTSRDGSSRHRDVSDGGVREWAVYESTRRSWDRIAAAQKIRFRISGSQFDVDATLLPSDLEVLRSIIKRFLGT